MLSKLINHILRLLSPTDQRYVAQNQTSVSPCEILKYSITEVTLTYPLLSPPFLHLTRSASLVSSYSPLRPPFTSHFLSKKSNVLSNEDNL